MPRRLLRFAPFLPLLLACASAAGQPATSDIPAAPRCVQPNARSSFFDPTRIRAAVVNRAYEKDLEVLRAVHALGANTLVTNTRPDLETARAAHAAGLFYLAWMSTDDLARAESDADFRAELISVAPLAGIYYEDDGALEGYTDPETQRRAYAQSKGLFPCALVLHPTRLDPIAWDPEFLTGYFRPEFSDLVTPYYYPVGTTVLGTASEEDAWEPLLERLLRAVAERTPAGKGVLPVLQGFEQIGFPVTAAFPSLQMRVFFRVWPANRNAAILGWGRSESEAPLVGFGFRPDLRIGLQILFDSLATAGDSPRVLAR